MKVLKIQMLDRLVLVGEIVGASLRVISDSVSPYGTELSGQI